MTEDPPTKDQMRTILEYAGGKKASQLVQGAVDEVDALQKLGENGEKFQRPVVSCLKTPDRLMIKTLGALELILVQTVDWNNGKVGESIIAA